MHDCFAVLYAVDLRELRRWVGNGSEARATEAWDLVSSGEDADWEDPELELLETLCRRMVVEGELYEGLPEDQAYYLTQILVDLFDECVDQETLSNEMILAGLDKAFEALPEAPRRLGRFLSRGRKLNSDRVIWTTGSPSDIAPFLGYVEREELPMLRDALNRPGMTRGSRPDRIHRTLLSAIETCLSAELDLVSFVG